MKVLLLALLLATVDAQLGPDCQIDDDCESTQFCAPMELINMVKAKLMGKEPEDMGGQDMGSAEAMGKCHPKMRLYEMCLMDNMCETGMCLRGPIPGDSGPPMGGKCVECRNDEDCSGNQYCAHPVINVQCIESLLFGLAMKKGDDDMKGMMENKKGGKDKGDKYDMDEPPKELKKFFEMLMMAIRDGKMEGGDADGPRPFPMFRNTREKRGLSSFVINGPTMRCMAKHPVNSPCRRSPMCQSDKCTIEGMCAI